MCELEIINKHLGFNLNKLVVLGFKSVNFDF